MEDIRKKIKEVLGFVDNDPAFTRGFSHSEFVEFALARHGWGDSDGGFGVTYPADLDEYDKEVEGMVIPAGHVEIYGFWGPEHGGYEITVKEADYIEELLLILEHEGHTDNIDALKSLHQTLRTSQ